MRPLGESGISLDLPVEPLS